jgi:two-component system response regulator HydG
MSEHTKSSILIVDDEQEHAQVMCEALQRIGYKCDVTYNLAEAQSRLNRKNYDVIVTDLMMDGRKDGLEVLRRAKTMNPPPPVLLVTAINDVPTSKQAMAEGAYDYIVKPLDLEDFRTQVNRAAERAALLKQNISLQEQLLESSAGFEGIIGTSRIMQQVVQTARQVANSDIPVLIMGENGTGKELIARGIHNNSKRRKQRLVALNCAGLSESILEDELFGHVRGAFTDARTERAGRFEHADNGTLFMDEIGDMPQAMQAKLLRVLENGEVVRLGSNEPIRVNVRLISATNRKLDEMVAEKHFREDLYFRIKGITIVLPPLRERREDIPLLVHYFMQQAAEKNGKTIDGIDPDAQQVLMNYSWPGNVRQLKNAVDTMVVLSQSNQLTVNSLPPDIRPPGGGVVGSGANVAGMSLEQLEKEAILKTLEMVHGNREQAAKMLGIGERTLYRKIKEYGLENSKNEVRSVE